MSRVLSYEEKDTWIHRLSGVTKLLFFLLWSITSMISYDTRVFLVMLVSSFLRDRGRRFTERRRR